MRAALALLVALVLVCARARAGEGPGAPGDKARWAKADKHGFGTSASRSSRVWFTLRQTEMTEVYYPDLSHPSARALEFMVDGKPVTGGTVANDALTYTQTSETRAWRLIRTYVTDPERATVLIKVRFESRDGEDHDVEIEFDPQLYNDGDDDVGWTPRPRAARPRPPHRLRAGRPPEPHAHELGLQGPRGVDAARAHLRRAAARQRHPAGPYAPHRPRGRRDLTLALGFAQVASQALAAAKDTLEQGWDATAAGYRDGWITIATRCSRSRPPRCRSAAAYETSLYTLKAHEDKDNPGAFVASPSRPWRADDDPNPPGTPLGARPLPRRDRAARGGDKVGANRALDFLLEQQDDDGSFPAYTRVDGKGDGEATAAQGLPIVLVHQLGRENWSRRAPPPRRAPGPSADRRYRRRRSRPTWRG